MRLLWLSEWIGRICLRFIYKFLPLGPRDHASEALVQYILGASIYPPPKNHYHPILKNSVCIFDSLP